MPRPQPTDKNAALRTMQIIAGALMLGIVSFGVVAAASMRGESDAEKTMLLAPIAAGAALFALGGCAIVPIGVGGASSASPSASSGDVASTELALYAAYQTRMIIRFALLEGAAMLNLAVALLEKQPYSLLIPGLLVVVMGTMFPTRGRLEAFVKAQSELRDLSDVRTRW